MLTVMSIVVSGNMTKLMDTGLMITQMAPSIWATGMKINSLAQVENHGLMVPAIRVVTSWERNMGKGRLYGLTGLSI